MFQPHCIFVYNGKYLSRFNDLFHNLLNNVLDYNKGKNRNGKCRIVIFEESDWLTINVSNDIDPEDTKRVLEDTAINKQEIDLKLSSGKSRGSCPIQDALFKNVWQPSPNRHSTEWEACMDKKKTRVILIIYFYDEERDIVSAIVKFLLI